LGRPPNGAQIRAERARRWRPDRLAYDVTLDATVQAGPVTLRAPDYDGSGLDWYSFDRSSVASWPPDAVATTYPGLLRLGLWKRSDVSPIAPAGLELQLINAYGATPRVPVWVAK
jgi:hypothetical protein